MKTEYKVTPRAGAWVAGQRVPVNGRLLLTKRQAAYELALGNIEPVKAGKPKPKAKAKVKR